MYGYVNVYGHMNVYVYVYHNVPCHTLEDPRAACHSATTLVLYQQEMDPDWVVVLIV